MLAAIFAVEAVLLTFSFVKCAEGLPPTVELSSRCPRIGQRAENIFEIAIATVLSLLAGSSGANVIEEAKKKRSPEEVSEL